jgi:hypothetical protein
VVDIDETELVGWQRLGELRLSHVIDRVQEPSVKDTAAPPPASSSKYTRVRSSRLVA